MKPAAKSKVVWFGGIVVVLGTINAISEAIDVTKLPPQVANWLLPVFGAVAMVLRLLRSNVTVK